jgi:biotin operon repressor
MSFNALAWAVKQDTKSPIAKLVLLMIANYCDENNKSYPSQEHLAKLCQCTRISINKHIKQLEKDNFLTIEKTKNNKYSFNIYTLNIGSVNNIYMASKLNLHNTQEDTNKIVKANNFELFWQNCPRKIGKKKVKQVYTKLLNDSNLNIKEEELIEKMSLYNLSVKHTEKKFICHPLTWLNQGRWEDILDITENKKEKYKDNWLM